MKNTTKKILAGVGLGLVGMGCLTGCSMSDEQMNALNVLTNNTETLVESFDSYLDGQNNKLDKEMAYDMLRQAKIKSEYILNESSICHLVVEMKDELDESSPQKMDIVYDFSTDVKKMMQKNPDGAIGVANCDLNNENKSFDVVYQNDEVVSIRSVDEEFYAQNVHVYIDALCQAGIWTVELDDITKVTVNEEGEYTFNIVKTAMDQSGQTYMKRVVLAEVVVKDYLFKSVKVQGINMEGTENSFTKENGEKVEDGFGGYVFFGNVVQILNMTATYEYGAEVSLSEMESRIADISSKLASGELVLGA